MIILSLCISVLSIIAGVIAIAFVFWDANNRSRAITEMNQREMELQSSLGALSMTHNKITDAQKIMGSRVESLETRVSGLSISQSGSRRL